MGQSDVSCCLIARTQIQHMIRVRQQQVHVAASAQISMLELLAQPDIDPEILSPPDVHMQLLRRLDSSLCHLLMYQTV